MSAPAAAESKPPLPPFTLATAQQKVKAAQAAWNSRDPEKVQFGYTPDSIWRNRDTFLQGRPAIVKFLTDKWSRENGYRLRKELFAFTDNKVCFSVPWLGWEGLELGRVGLIWVGRLRCNFGTSGLMRRDSGGGRMGWRTGLSMRGG